MAKTPGLEGYKMLSQVSLHYQDPAGLRGLRRGVLVETANLPIIIINCKIHHSKQ